MSEFTLSNGNPVLVHTNVYADGTLFATYDTQELHFYLNDWLGTRRVQTDSAGMVEQDGASLPYGDSETCTPLPSGALFTGKENDAETAGGVSPFGTNQGNDYFGARYYNSVAGRWLSPDWSAQVEPVPYAKLDDPQSLNLYAYVFNNPLTGVDLDGHGCDGSTQGFCDPSFRDALLHGASADEVSAAQQAQQQKYDPSKSGPEDPTNPGHPLYKNSVVKKASDKAFMQTMDGQAGNGLAESGFAIALKNGKIAIESWTSSVNGSGKLNQLSIDTSDPDTIAILHTHGNNALPTPSPGDRNPNVQFPDFVRSRSALYVTIPHSASGSPPLNQYIELQ
jgi:RHS repeat-associated protein